MQIWLHIAHMISSMSFHFSPFFSIAAKIYCRSAGTYSSSCLCACVYVHIALVLSLLTLSQPTENDNRCMFRMKTHLWSPRQEGQNIIIPEIFSFSRQQQTVYSLLATIIYMIPLLFMWMCTLETPNSTILTYTILNYLSSDMWNKMLRSICKAMSHN